MAATARPALAHPRSIAITNDGDADDADERILVTEFFAQRTSPEANDGSNVDVNWVGIVYRIDASDGSAAVSLLGAVGNTGFKDHLGADTGCFPNQLQSVTVEGGLAYVTSICASPKGPVGGFQKKACTSNTPCTDPGSTCDTTAGVGACTLQCAADADCGFGSPAGTCRGNADPGLGFNVPSVLGMSVGAPFFHAGNARTLEELLGDLFETHRNALAPSASFLAQPGEIAELVAYLLSIDETSPAVDVAASPGADGGDFCKFP